MFFTLHCLFISGISLFTVHYLQQYQHHQQCNWFGLKEKQGRKSNEMSEMSATAKHLTKH